MFANRYAQFMKVYESYCVKCKEYGAECLVSNNFFKQF